MKAIEDILTGAGIHPTANRITIYRAISSMDSAFSVSDLEIQLETLDKSTIFRTLTIFQENKLIHELDDGSGSRKYCLCRCHDDSHHSHVHFTCNICHKTYCIRDIEVNHLQLPASFEVTDINYVMKGICPACRRD